MSFLDRELAADEVRLRQLIAREAVGVDEQGRLVWDPTVNRTVVEPDSHVNVRGLPPYVAGLGGNDGDVFQAAVDRAHTTGIGVAWVPEGDYTVEKTINGYDGVELVLHPQARVTFTASGTGAIFYRVTGTESASTPLVAAAAENDSCLEVAQAWITANASALADNCLIRVMSEAFFANDPTGTGANLNGRIGELLYVGRPTSTLSTAIDADDTTLTIARTGDARTSNFPRSGFIQVGSEIIGYSTITPTSTGFVFGTSSQPNVRGARSTTAASHAQNAAVTMPDGMLAARARLQGGTYYPLANSAPTATTLGAPLTASATVSAQLVDAGDMRSRGTVRLASGETVGYTSVDYANNQLLGLTRGAGAIDQASGLAVTQVDMARVSIVTPARKAALRGGTIISSDYARQHTGVRFDLTVDCDIDSVEFVGFASQAMFVTDSINHRVARPRVTGVKSSTSTFYGVVHQGACQDCSVTEGFFKDVRHATSNGAGTVFGGLVRRLNVSTCVAYDTTSYGFDCHAGAEDATYTDCHVFGTDYIGGGGFAVRCPSARWIGCTVDGVSSSGWSIKNQTMTPSRYQIDGCAADNTGAVSVLVVNTLGGTGELAADLLTAATTATVADAAGFSSLGGTIRIGDEVITYTSRTGVTLSGLTRGVDGTDAADHFAGAEIERGRPGTGGNIKGLTITGSVFSRPTGNCITIQSTDTYRQRNVSITGNVFSAPTLRAIYALHADAITIVGNQFEGIPADQTAIYFDDVTDSTIGLNPKIQGAGVGTATHHGIDLVGCDGIIVSANTVRGFFYGVRATNTSTNCTVIANDLRSNDTWAVLPDGQGHLYRTNDGSPLNQGDDGIDLDQLDIGLTLRVGQTDSGGDAIAAPTALMRGLELYAKSANASTAKFFPALKAISGDPDLGAERTLGYWVPAATETYASNVDGGLEWRAYTTPKNGGASDPLLAMTIRDDQGVDVVGALTTAGNAVATSVDVAAALAVPQAIPGAGGSFIIDDTVGTSIRAFRSGQIPVASATNSSSAATIAAFTFDPARWAISGKTTKLRLIVAMMMNAVAPGQDLTVHLLKVATSTGSSTQTAQSFPTSGSVASLTWTAAALAAGGILADKIVEITAPAAGVYVPGVLAAGSLAAGTRPVAVVSLAVFYA